MLRSLREPDASHPGQRFIARLLNEFTINGPNGYYHCLVQEPAVRSITSKDDSTDFMFPVETAKSVAAQLIMGLSYLHSKGVCHGGKKFLTGRASFKFHPPFVLAVC